MNYTRTMKMCLSPVDSGYLPNFHPVIGQDEKSTFVPSSPWLPGLWISIRDQNDPWTVLHIDSDLNTRNTLETMAYTLSHEYFLIILWRRTGCVYNKGVVGDDTIDHL